MTQKERKKAEKFLKNKYNLTQWKIKYLELQ